MVMVAHPEHRLAAEPFVVAHHFTDEHVLLYTEDPFSTTLMRTVLPPCVPRHRPRGSPRQRSHSPAATGR
jgi:hypothetical protein